MSAEASPLLPGPASGAAVRQRRVAVIGSGIAGLASAHALAPQASVTLFEAGSWFGGHSHTVDVTLPDAQGRAVTHGVDTGFLVFNHRTYPQLVQLFQRLGVETAPSDMSFSVQAPGLEWSGSSLNAVFAQRSNLFKPRFLGMLADILRFNRLCTALAVRGHDAELAEPIGDFLDREGFGARFRNGYFLPMIGCIWSCPTDQMLRFPIGTMIRFCHNHGLIQVADRPQWHTVRGGAKHYVQRMLQDIADARLNTPVLRVRRHPQGVAVHTDAGVELFDDAVLACHSDQSLALLGEDASADERTVLGAIRYHPNHAVLHTDTRVLPQRPLAWAAWNYARAVDAVREQAAVCLHYLINRLQPLPWAQPVVVTLNPDPAREPDPALVLGAWAYSHPVFDSAAVAAQRQLPGIQGVRNTWFCGAWTRYGFHEDGLMSAQDVAARLQRRWAGARHTPPEADPAAEHPALAA
jgi:predicted NAD/FAD-binding protein